MSEKLIEEVRKLTADASSELLSSLDSKELHRRYVSH
jgi:hypothetical protein